MRASQAREDRAGIRDGGEKDAEADLPWRLGAGGLGAVKEREESRMTDSWLGQG